MSNTFGNIYRLTDFGESHGPAIGGVVDGMPAGVSVDFDEIRRWLARRRPGQSTLTTSRKEADEVRFLSGIYEGRTLGTPIGFIIENVDARSADYEELRHKFRPNHADYTYQAKYGIRDYRGGGRASARETAVRVVGGALAMQVLKQHGISVNAYALQVGKATEPDAMEREIRDARAARDTVGAIVGCTVSGIAPGLGEPVFDKLQALLASAMMSINAAKGFDYGSGFDGAACRGSELVDTPFFDADSQKVRMRTNHSGGIQGGISNGEDIYFRVAFKPIATLPQPLETIDDEFRQCTLDLGGRHDPCVVPRAIVVVEAMAAMTVLDAMMMAKAASL